ncbi:flagellar basal body rod protein FlgC [Syntrophus aciditrophicus]|uniref:Flagellar basal-body rod protein FlgC n=1 Tax=Syntrophus aciditrophicus (strain SB) TaxID=56780 RepID=Q2LRY8_SYNAS|nr:flagellar basal body rod protein FlgC [Syntrophus aciditrophicus]ABC76849.1 flagellar basal-body rod protein [Syntrophus aciditrophicus SB]OPY17765.1 MAG: Flagellar basal-body rod protein FlgC [Syntrophus sp. PtaB.Bin075]
MDFLTSFRICSSGFAAQRAKMDVIASNLANVSTTSTPEGGPYKRKVAIFSSENVKQKFRFGDRLRDAIREVALKEVVEDGETVRKVYDPSHPDADQQGNVAMPNVNVMMEMTDMITASRAYEACVTAFDATKNMALKTLDIGK